MNIVARAIITILSFGIGYYALFMLAFKFFEWNGKRKHK